MSKNKLLALAVLPFIGTFVSCASANNTKTENAPTTVTIEKNRAAAENKQTESKSTENKSANESVQTNLVEIYDGRKNEKLAEVSESDSDFVKNAIKESDAAVQKYIKNLDAECKPNPEVYSVSEGSFTAPNSSQKIYAYRLCVTDVSGVTSGIMIAENGKATANYFFKSSDMSSEGFDLKVLPDINKNGLSEFAVITNNGGQGSRYGTLTLVEYQKGGVLKTLGWTESDTVAFNSASSKETTVKISVEPASKPVFYVERYEKKDNAKDWSLSKKQEKFSLTPEGKHSTAFLKAE